MKIIAQNFAQLIILKTFASLELRKKVAQNMGYFCNFRKTAQSERFPNGQKFAQSGRLASNRISQFQLLVRASSIAEAIKYERLHR
jgi:hypothetical protein